MAFAQAGLHKIAEGLFRYTTTDAAATIAGSGYFNTAYKQLKQYDVIIAIDTDAPTIDLLWVTSATNATTVTTSAVEGVTAT